VATNTHDHRAVARDDPPKSLFRGPPVAFEELDKEILVVRIRWK